MFIILICETILTKDTILWKPFIPSQMSVIMLLLVLITARKRSCGKVMFLHLSVILFTGRSLSSGGSLSSGCLCQVGVSVKGGSLSRGVSVCRGSLSGGVSVQGVSVQGGLSPEGCLCPGGSLSRGGLCVGGVSVQGCLSRGWVGLCPDGGVSVRETTHMVKNERYASYWNAFLSGY